MSGDGPWSDLRYARIAAVVEARAGLSPPTCPASAEEGMKRAMARAGVKDLTSYLSLVETSDRAVDDLLTELTVGETYFFRTVEHFDYLREVLLPSFEQAAPGRPIRTWSAGCSTGEEPYSLAAVLLESGFRHRMSVLGTDVSRASLGRARAAEYGEWSLRGQGADQIRPYLTPEGKRFKLSAQLRDKVELQYLNLALDVYPSLSRGLTQMDVIFCRNVLIYFQPPVVEAVAKRLWATLSERGCLITGPSDPSLAAFADFEPVLTGFGLVYRKRDPHRPLASQPPLPIALPVSPSPVALPPPLAPAAPLPPAATPGISPAQTGRPASTPPRETADAGAPKIDRARRAFRDGRWQEALSLLEGEAAPAALELSIQAQANVDLNRARTLCEDAMVQHPLHAGFRQLQALLLMGLGRIDEGERAASQAVYLDPSLVVAQLALGQLLRRKGLLPAAARAYREAERLCRALPADAEVPLAAGETAGRLAEVAGNERALLERVPEAELARGEVTDE